jgi:hypothetical protein
MKLDQLDSQHRRLVVSIALDIGADPEKVASAVHVAGGFWECRAFLNRYPRGTTEAAPLIERLRQGGAESENVLIVIENSAPPDYRTIAEATDAELDELLASI